MAASSAHGWCIGAKVAAVALALGSLLLAGRMAWSWTRGLSPDEDLATAVGGTVLVSFIITYLLWLAWRLWARWNSSTVRWAVGSVVGVCAMILVSQADAVFKARMDDDVGTALTALLILPSLPAAAFVYHRINQMVIRRAQLPDPVYANASPRGRGERLRVFAILMGLAVFHAAGRALDLIQQEGPGPDAWTAVSIFAPIVLGVLAYKLVVWLLVPPDPTIQPPGGFQVVTPPERH